MTRQMETDSAVEEREVLLQRAERALGLGDSAEIRMVRDQLRQYREMYAADLAMSVVEAQLRRLDRALDEKSPDAYAFEDDAVDMVQPPQ